jgi:HSP20 family protein
MTIRISGVNPQINSQENANSPLTPARLFEDFFNNMALGHVLARRQESWKPPVDILEYGGNLIIRAEIPGIDEKDMELKLDGRTLTIKGERREEAEGAGVTYHRVESNHGSFSRSFDLPDSVDAQNVSASFQKGVLTVTIPQKPEVKPRTIKVNQGS